MSSGWLCVTLAAFLFLDAVASRRAAEVADGLPVPLREVTCGGRGTELDDDDPGIVDGGGAAVADVDDSDCGCDGCAAAVADEPGLRMRIEGIEDRSLEQSHLYRKESVNNKRQTSCVASSSRLEEADARRAANACKTSLPFRGQSYEITISHLKDHHSALRSLRFCGRHNEVNSSNSGLFILD